MGKVRSIRDKVQKSNAVYSLISRIQTYEIRDRRPDLFWRCKKMVAALVASREADDRLKKKVREILPADMSPLLIPAAESFVAEAGEALRDDLLNLFLEEINEALKREQN